MYVETVSESSLMSSESIVKTLPICEVKACLKRGDADQPLHCPLRTLEAPERGFVHRRKTHAVVVGWSEGRRRQRLVSTAHSTITKVNLRVLPCGGTSHVLFSRPQSLVQLAVKSPRDDREKYRLAIARQAVRLPTDVKAHGPSHTACR